MVKCKTLYCFLSAIVLNYNRISISAVVSDEYHWTKLIVI